ncbi:cytochrome C biosynthesis protein [Shewanella youngdeokensis]|uniref:Cytochrome C biosynthesis protein n=1 Tax=Shewanella youngdeokensis TaxID=2999068 RepID=A0ABZ0JZG0_9GAMM|nr:cytochrome C biosynthesis protein [Shewanella sp. DAU334]
MTHYILLLVTLVFSSFSLPTLATPASTPPVTSATAGQPITWHYTNEQGELKVKLYFFWSKTCPHCKEAHPFIDSLPKRYPWIELETHLITDPGTMAIWLNVAKQTGTEAGTVPYFASGNKTVMGYSSQAVTGEFLVSRLKAYYRSVGGTLSADNHDDYPTKTSAKPGAFFETCSKSSSAGTCDIDLGSISTTTSDVQPVELPLIGIVHPEEMSLPLLTIVLAGVDAFNPCAFFVLLFLLSIMVNAKSRTRMLIVGGIFVFFSGLIYFIFMSAWLNIFQLLGAGSDGGWIILGAGILALLAGAVNIKDYFFTKGEVTLSMSAENRTGLIKRMGKLTSASSMTAMIAGTVVLSILANAYELLCTAGFPMIYTSVLAMHELPTMERYLYLAFYNVVYVIPLAMIVIAFSVSLGKRKLTEKEGQTLKLMSGIMMVGLGGMLAIDPTALQNVVLAIGLILSSITLTFIITLVRKAIEKNKAK